MKHQRVDLSKLVASDQPRPLITADVDKLAASIKDVGLIQPITVKPRAIMSGGLAAQGFQIVAGHHRVAACRALGWAEIDAIVIEVGEHLQAELIEIDENLCRSELTAAQRSKAVKRRKEIWEALHPVMKTQIQVGQAAPPESVIGYKQPPAQEKAFAAETAALTGEDKRTINRHIARAEALGDDLDKVAGTSLDKGVELDALKAMPPEVRAPLIERAQAGENVSARSEQKPAAAPAKPQHNTASLILALKQSMAHLLYITDCKTVDQVVELICDTFGPEHEHDVALYQVLDDFCAVGHLEPVASQRGG